MKKRSLALLLALILVFALIAGCGSKTPADPDTPSADAPASTPATPDATTPDSPPVQDDGPAENEPKSLYPVTEDIVTFEVYWGGLGDVISHFPDTTYWSGNAAGKAVTEATNVYIEWYPFERDLMTQQLSLMLAGGEYCDGFNCADIVFPGSIDSLIDDGVAIDVTDLLPTYAPDYLKVLEENETFRKETTMDDGSVIALYSLNAALPRSGLQIRKDMLEEFGTDIPTNLDEVHDFLAQVKSKYNSSTPFLTTSYLCDEYNTMSAAFGINWSRTAAELCLQVDDAGKVVASVTLPGLKDYLMLLNQWYTEGLMSDACLGISNERFMNDYIYTSDCVFFAGGHNNSMSEGFKALCNSDTFEMVAVPDLALNADDTDFYNEYGPAVGSFADGSGFVITTACDNPGALLSWINYGFTDEGAKYYCLGVEDELYYVADDGSYQYTELYTNPPDGLPQMFVGMLYRAAGLYKSMEEASVMGMNENQLNAYDVWMSRRDPNGPKLFHGALSSDEKAAVVTYETDLITYIDENTSRFVFNEKSFDEWDSFIQGVYDLHLDEIVENYQAAYDRYCSK